MKTIKIKYLLYILITFFTFGCAKEDDIELQSYNTLIFFEDFSNLTIDDDNDVFVSTRWFNFNEVGSKKWVSQYFAGDKNGYVEFSAFGSSQLINVGWLISPALNMDLHDGEKLEFQSAPNFLRSRDNTLELLVSTNFDGTNVLAADWINIPVKTASPDDKRFEYIDSGVVDLSKYKGNLHFAFKVKGSGTNSNLSGTYQIDNINLYYPSK